MKKTRLFKERFSSYRALFSTIKNKKKELLSSICVILILTIILTIILFISENKVQPNNFDNVFTSFFWAISKYISGIGGYGNFLPVTLLGQMIGTIIGILYIALIAIPSGIIASGFVEEMTKTNEAKELVRIRELITNAFSIETNKVARETKEYFGLTTVPRKKFPIEDCQAALNLSSDDIYKTVRNSDNFRLRFRPSTTITNIEYFQNNKSYGSYENRNSIFTVICTTSARDAYIGHYTSAVAKLLGANYLSIENFSSIEMIPDYRFDFSDSIYIKSNLKISDKAAIAFNEFQRDINELNAANNYILYFESVVGEELEEKEERIKNKEAEKKKEEKYNFHVLAGGSKGENAFNKQTSTVDNFEKLVNFYNEFEVEINKLGIKVFSHQSYGSFDEYHLHNYLRKRGFNVISIFITTPLLLAKEAYYYGSIRKLVDMANKYFTN